MLKISKDMVIGDLLKLCPEVKPVIENYFGKGCFSCPGIIMETLAFGAGMHGVDVEKMLEEIREVCQSRL
jgi:hybrid cluster-associated redox disulfide protein